MNSTVSERYPLCKEDFHVLVCECASDEWKDLARTVTEGTASFQQMEEIIENGIEIDSNVFIGVSNRVCVSRQGSLWKDQDLLFVTRRVISPTQVRPFTNVLRNQSTVGQTMGDTKKR
ncbi:hypothetical protein DAPPUDRAFT_273210, partial [Daphnia pulex]